MAEPQGMINLPEDVWDKLRDLQQELDEGRNGQGGARGRGDMIAMLIIGYKRLQLILTDIVIC